MKYKNYKSAIHNFTHSFISIDKTKSERLAIDVLIDLYNRGLETKSSFDFINQTILPDRVVTEESRQLIIDYMSWLPDHFENHNCNLSKLEKLVTTYWTDFDKAFSPPGMKSALEFTISAQTVWRADGRKEQTIEVSQTELINKSFLQLRIPEIK
ncbi:MAG: hypothetical protein AAFY91_03865 [Bacteroidota bacterium]